MTEDTKSIGAKKQDVEEDVNSRITLRSVTNRVEKNNKDEKKAAMNILNMSLNNKNRNRLANAGFFIGSAIDKKSIGAWFSSFFWSSADDEAKALEEHDEKLREVGRQAVGLGLGLG